MKRRSFLAGASAGLAAGAISPSARAAGAPPPPSVVRPPDGVLVETEEGRVRLERASGAWAGGGVEVAADVREGRLAVSLAAPKAKPKRVRLRWNGAFPEGWRFLGDHWERAYGDLEWRGLVGERPMPWYFLATDGDTAHGYGVATGAAAVAWWQADAGGISLWLDVRNGGSGVELGARRLVAAEVVERRGRAGEGAFAAARAFCRAMCAAPRLPRDPVYGSNNWYYAYGENMSAEATLRDAELAAELSPSGPNRPYVVIDMGWAEAPDGAGPSARTQKHYPDMPALVAGMRRATARPGIWTRPLLTSDPRAEAWRLPAIRGREQGALSVIDPTIPEAAAHVAENTRLLAAWGFELIKHDYTTYDLWGRWGFETGTELTDGGWHFADRSRTTAEVMSGLYRTIRDAAGDALLIGCNTVGHLGAGLFELQRVGDDTSGREWARTRKMGVNALAFRAPQHGTFFAADADCVPVTADVPWSLTRRWLDLVARSGTALFVSPDPAAVRAEQKPALREALAAAARPSPTGEPLDWLDTTIPTSWRLGGRPARFDWYAEE